MFVLFTLFCSSNVTPIFTVQLITIATLEIQKWNVELQGAFGNLMSRGKPRCAGDSRGSAVEIALVLGREPRVADRPSPLAARETQLPTEEF